MQEWIALTKLLILTVVNQSLVSQFYATFYKEAKAFAFEEKESQSSGKNQRSTPHLTANTSNETVNGII